MVTDVNTLALVQADHEDSISATVNQGVYWISVSDVASILGWEVEPEGLCKGEVCIPLRDSSGFADGDSLNLTRLAELIGRPLAVSVEDQAAYLGTPFEHFGATVGRLEAPEFSLPDLVGDEHNLSNNRGSKILIAAWASW
jgi:hypothetical protein